MESVLHTMYVVAIKNTAAWEGDSPAELSMIGFWNLVIVWLKVYSYISEFAVCADKYAYSCSFLGDFSVFGLYSMVSIPLKT